MYGCFAYVYACALCAHLVPLDVREGFGSPLELQLWLVVSHSVGGWKTHPRPLHE